MRTCAHICVTVALALAMLAPRAPAAVKLPALFSDHENGRAAKTIEVRVDIHRNSEGLS